MEEKCEISRLWPCPHCFKDIHRGYHLRKHHNKHHKDCSDAKCCSKQRVTPKSALGCGYCIHPFDGPKGFIAHLIKHFEEDSAEPQWDHTRSVHSLLQHPRFRTIWNKICAARFGCTSRYWQNLTWDMELVEQEVHALQYGTYVQGLKLCLIRLLEKGIGPNNMLSIPSNPEPALPMAPSSPNLANLTTANIMMYDSFDDGLLVDDTPSTLVDTQDLWAKYTTLSNDASTLEYYPWAPSDSKTDPVWLDKETDFGVGVISLTTFDTMEDSALHPSNIMSPEIDVSGIMTDNMDDLVMNSIPADYQHISSVNEPYFTLGVDANNNVGALSWTSEPPSFRHADGFDYLPPFNPTPRLPGHNSHERSLSGRLLRMIQNYPCISPTY